MFSEARIARAGFAFVGVLFCIAASSKIVEPKEFNQIVQTVLSPNLRLRWIFLLGAVVVCWEMLLGMRLVVRPVSRRVCIALLVTMLAFSGTLAYIAIAKPSSSCGCFIGLFGHLGNDPKVGLIRNAAVAALCVVFLPARGLHDRKHLIVSERPDSIATNGFTLIEVLVVMVVIAVLVALALPSLRASRQSARDATSSAIGRQVFVALSQYERDQREMFPYLATPQNPDAPVVVNGYSAPTGGYFFWQSALYVSLLTPYLDSTAGLAIPGQPRELSKPAPGVFRSRYFLAHAAFARSAYWHDDDPPAAMVDLVGTTWSEVSFPSNKGVLIDLAGASFAPGQSPPNSVYDVLSVAADGSSRRFQLDIVNNTNIVGRPFGCIPWPVLATRDGWRGRDF